MPINLLTGMTHAIVTVPTRRESDATGVRAVVSLCCGPGDDTAIGQLWLMKSDAGLSWRVPHVVSPIGTKSTVPVFTGEWLTQLCAAGARAIDRVRRDCGGARYGKRYRVYIDANPQGTAVEEVAA